MFRNKTLHGQHNSANRHSYLSPSLCRSYSSERKVNGTSSVSILGWEASREDGCVCRCQGCLKMIFAGNEWIKTAGSASGSSLKNALSPRPKVQTTPLFRSTHGCRTAATAWLFFRFVIWSACDHRIICFAKALMGKFHTTRGNMGLHVPAVSAQGLRCAPSLMVHLGPLLSLLAIRGLGGLETFPWPYSVSADSGSSKRGQISPS